MNPSSAISRLLEELERLPGIGPKSAQRIAYHLLNTDSLEVKRLASTIVEVKDTVRFCTQCSNYAEADLCDICASTKRDTSIICVVEEPRDVGAIEKTGEYSGLYHVLRGVISPMDGIGPDELTVASLMSRLASDSVTEVLIATNPTVEGETTASYLARLIKPLGISVTRLASGLPVGGDLEYADEVTLGRAISARRIM